MKYSFFGLIYRFIYRYFAFLSNTHTHRYILYILIISQNILKKKPKTPQIYSKNIILKNIYFCNTLSKTYFQLIFTKNVFQVKTKKCFLKTFLIKHVSLLLLLVIVVVVDRKHPLYPNNNNFVYFWNMKDTKYLFGSWFDN